MPSPLPFDILEHIVFQTRYSRSTLLNLCVVSRDVQELANAHLYRTVNIRADTVDHRVASFLRSVFAKRFGHLVHFLNLDCSISHRQCGSVITALHAMTNLRHLYIRDLQVIVDRNPNCAEVFRRLRLLRSICLNLQPWDDENDTPLSQVLDVLPAMKQIAVVGVSKSRIASLDRIIQRSRCTLQSLEITGPRGLESFEDHPLIIYPALKTVSIRSLNSVNVALAMPNVEDLRLTTGSNASLDLLGNQVLMPSLRQLDIFMAGHLFGSTRPVADPPQRCLDHLQLKFQTMHQLVYFSNLVQFSALRSLILDGVMPSDTVFLPDVCPLVLGQCKSLEYLQLSTRNISGRIEAVSVEAFKTLNRTERMNSYNSRLRYFSLSFGPSTWKGIWANAGDTILDDYVEQLFTTFTYLQCVQITQSNSPLVWKRGAPRGDAVVQLDSCFRLAYESDVPILPSTLEEVADMLDQNL